MAHETFAESRRRTFISTPELEELILQLTDFAVSCLDEVDEDDMDAFQQQSRDMNTTTEDFSSGRYYILYHNYCSLPLDLCLIQGHQHYY